MGYVAGESLGGDVWDRRPRELRRCRMYWGISLIYTVGIYLPLVLMSMYFRRLP